jgi:uncharacterized protein
MPDDLIRYDVLAQEALRGLVRKVLSEVAQTGLPGEHHFFITFDTRHPGVRISSRLRAQYPNEMTVVLQHQFWDLGVTDSTFEVGLSFNGVPERLLVPLHAITSFVDPQASFGLKFDAPVAEAEAAPAPVGEAEPIASLPVPVPQDTTPTPPPPSEGAAVVSLDAFRKKNG